MSLRTVVVILGAFAVAVSGKSASAAALPASSQPDATSRPSVSPTDFSNLSIDELMNVQVDSVSKHTQRVADAPGAITVITEEDIARSHLDSIPELLRLVPGMDVDQVDANKWAISARGFNDLFANKLQVIFDGRTVYSDNFAGVYWDAQDYVLQDLNRIEVIRGPGATLWGANAVNGVVNIESKSADQTQGLLTDGWESNIGQNASLRYGGKLDDQTYYRAYGKFSNTDNFKNADGSDASDGWDSQRGGFRIDRFSTDKDTLTLEGDAFNERSGQTNVVPTFTFPFTTFLPTLVSSSGVDFISRWTHTVDDKSDFALQLYYDRYNRDEYVLNSTTDTFDLDFHDRFPLGDRQELTWGGGSRVILDNLKSTSLVTVNPATQHNYLINQFVQDDLALNPDHLHLFVGSKFEENNRTDFEIQPSARLLWTPNDKNTVWGAISRAVRTPSVADLNTTFVEARLTVPPPPAGGTAVETDLIPNDTVESEEMVAYELGYRTALTDSLSIDIDGYVNQYDKVRDFLAGAPQFVVTPFPHLLVPLTEVNYASGPIYGFAVAGNLKVNENWKWMASYSMQQSHLSTTLNQQVVAQINGQTPVNQFQIHSYLNLTKALQFDTGLYYVDRLKFGDVPSYTRFDMAVTWRPSDNISLSAGVQNLFDNQHPEFPGTAAFTASSEIPRTYFGQFSWRF